MTGGRDAGEIVEFYVTQGSLLVGSGTIQRAHLSDVYVPPGGAVTEGPAPEPDVAPPSDEARWDVLRGTWFTPAKSDEELAAQARFERDQLLQQYDWVTLRAYDRGEPVPQGWRDYFQALRDITEQPGFPTEVVWPEAPTG